GQQLCRACCGELWGPAGLPGGGGGGGNKKGQAGAKRAGSNPIPLGKRALRPRPPKRTPPRSSPRGRNAWTFAPAQDARRKEWRTRNAHPPHRWTRPGLRWRDVLRSVERVAGVEPALDLAQPRIDRSRKGRAHACFALVLGHEIDIGAAGREPPGGAPIFPRPDEMATILLRALPRRLDVQHVGCRSQADRVHARIETRGG